MKLQVRLFTQPPANVEVLVSEGDGEWVRCVDLPKEFTLEDVLVAAYSATGQVLQAHRRDQRN